MGVVGDIKYPTSFMDGPLCWFDYQIIFCWRGRWMTLISFHFLLPPLSVWVSTALLNMGSENLSRRIFMNCLILWENFSISNCVLIWHSRHTQYTLRDSCMSGTLHVTRRGLRSTRFAESHSTDAHCTALQMYHLLFLLRIYWPNEFTVTQE